MKFYLFAQALDAIRPISSRNHITELLAELYHHATAHEAHIMTYLLLGLLRPPYQGPTLFAIADKTMKAMLADILGISTSAVTQQMSHYGDPGVMLEQGTWKAHTSPTLLEMYQALKTLEEISGDKSHALRTTAFKELVTSISPLEAALVARIVLGKLRLGFSEMTIIDALSWMIIGTKSLRDQIEAAYNVTADLGLIAEEVKSHGVEGLKEHQPHVGIPILPAAAERAPSAEAIIKRMGPCIIEPKVDGFRLQVHVIHHGQKVEVRFFSRNLQPMQGIFPELEEAMKSYPHNLIVEGEAVAYDRETDSYFSFQETVKRKRKYEIHEAATAYPLRLNLFDIMLYNDKPCIKKPHHERFKLLEAAYAHFNKGAQELIKVLEHKRATTAHEIEEYFNYEVSRGFEGIMAKRDDAPYQAGKRNFVWIKLKYQGIGGLEDTIDAVVLGYYHGHGKRAQFGIGSCLIGVYDKTQDAFVTLAKLGTGLSDDDWKQLKKAGDEHALKQKPHNVICNKVLEPHIWVEPSIVIEVAADAITRSPVHSAGLALRFPRMVKFRFDKSASEATTVTEVRHMYEDQGKKK
jgi:DNA ligase-1